MHDGVKRDNDLQRGQSLENNQHHLMIDGEPSITAFELANRPTSVHRLGSTKGGTSAEQVSIFLLPDLMLFCFLFCILLGG